MPSDLIAPATPPVHCTEQGTEVMLVRWNFPCLKSTWHWVYNTHENMHNIVYNTNSSFTAAFIAKSKTTRPKY